MRALAHKPLSQGMRVTVRQLMPPGHVRAPAYLRGKSGTIERRIAPFKNPEKLAYGLPAEEQMLYRVRFDARELWGPQAESNDDMIEAEIYAHWLEPEDQNHAT
ncbi:MAG: SH3-like domain-containing protein [Planktotalea sp.]|uniref:SH3-like domain-containing protein n=1 Tax=Planktotalea sp. TaxID=2029877 RepID=UPI003C70F2BE